MRYSILRHKRITVSRIVATLLIAIVIFTETQIKNGTVVFLLDNIGLILIVIGVFGRIWASMYIAGYKKTELITQGPYARVRNPLYFFSFLAVMGIVLSSRNLIFMILTPVCFMIYYTFVILGEEKRLLDHHGDRFIEYMNKTNRFFPTLNRQSISSQSQTYEVNIVTFYKVFLDAIWFFIAYVLIDIVTILHSKNIIPLIFKF